MGFDYEKATKATLANWQISFYFPLAVAYSFREERQINFCE